MNANPCGVSSKNQKVNDQGISVNINVYGGECKIGSINLKKVFEKTAVTFTILTQGKREIIFLSVA